MDRDGVELVAISSQQLKEEEEATRAKEKREQEERARKAIDNVKFIKTQEGVTSKDLDQRKIELAKFLEKKQQRSRDEFFVKQSVLKTEFKESVNRLIDQIKHQKEIVIKSYGPLMLHSKKQEPDLFTVNKNLDPVGYRWIKDLEAAQRKVPQTVLVKVRSVRCLKDKVASGHYLCIVHCLDRPGGNRIAFNHQRTEHVYKNISKNLREYAKQKREYLN